jgi:hypothetical protein
MTKTRISTVVPLGVIQMIRKSTETNPGLCLLLCGQGATIRRTLLVLIAALLAANPLPVSAASPDPVLEWIGVMNTAVLAAGTAPNVTSRVVALVSASVFDAVNGIEPCFRPLQVRPNAPHHASQRAAAIQAAYAILLNLYPAQSGMLATQRNASLAALALTENANSIAAGVALGQTVADAIWTSRLTDGFTPPPPPFLGAPVVGVWRPTPPANASGATPQIATMTPWVLRRPSQFRLPPPLALTSREYAADLNEVKVMGSLAGSMRTPDQSELALFWALNTPLAWNRIAAQISAERGLTLTENAHLFALLNLTLSDALIACWDSKYRYVFWRPITAIRAGLTPADADPLWEPWLDSLTGTPAHPEYPSAHSSMSGAAAFILAAAFGENTDFSLTSEVRPGTTRSFHNFSDAIAEIADARVFGGIHFRTSCVRANTLGRAVADFVSRHVMREQGDDRDDEKD